MGYHRAGFEVVGVDIKPQPRYPFEFLKHDAMGYLCTMRQEEDGRWHNAFTGPIDVIHASPPCQAYSTTKGLHDKRYPMLVDAVRCALKDIGNPPFIIENVRGAPLKRAVLLCGSSFGLGVWRHRLFESNILLLSPGCTHWKTPAPLDITGTGGPCLIRATAGGGAHRKPKNMAEAKAAMGIDWMCRRELVEAIPPAYTEFIGRQLMRAIKAADGA